MIHISRFFLFLGVTGSLFITYCSGVQESKTLPLTPPHDIPRLLYNDYTLDNKISVAYWYFNNAYSNNNPRIYKKSTIDKLVALALRKKTKTYGITALYLYQACDTYRAHIKNKRVGIIGSTYPWYESIIISYGGIPTTIEYNKLISQDPRLTVTTVDEYKKSPIIFDALLSISSFEHDGLGRYGDPLDPYGDIKAMQKAQKMLKPNGLLFLAVPIGKDTLVWNAHRIYGELRFPMLIDGWDIVDTFGFNKEDLQKESDIRGSHQPIFVLRARI